MQNAKLEIQKGGKKMQNAKVKIQKRGSLTPAKILLTLFAF